MPCHLCNKWDLRNSFPTPKAYFQYVINNPELDEQRAVLESVTFQNRSGDDCKVFPERVFEYNDVVFNFGQTSVPDSGQRLIFFPNNF